MKNENGERMKNEEWMRSGIYDSRRSSFVFGKSIQKNQCKSA
jgi:hypothetical protein